jgi:hypothetical protein
MTVEGSGSIYRQGDKHPIDLIVVPSHRPPPGFDCGFDLRHGLPRLFVPPFARFSWQDPGLAGVGIEHRPLAPRGKSDSKVLRNEDGGSLNPSSVSQPGPPQQQRSLTLTWSFYDCCRLPHSPPCRRSVGRIPSRRQDHLLPRRLLGLCGELVEQELAT